MPKTLFAVKLDIREKECIDMVSETTGATMASLHLASIRDRLHRNLGFVLLHRVHGERVEAGDMASFISDEAGALRRKTPVAVLNLITHLGRPDSLGRLRAVLPALGEGTDDPVLPEVDLGRLMADVGEGYINGEGDPQAPDPALVLNLALSSMVEATFNSLARGSMQGLATQWQGARSALAELRADLVADYIAEFKVRKVRGPSAASPGARKASVTAKTPAGSRTEDKKGRKGRKKKKKKGAKETEGALEAVEVAPVVEVDEIED